MRLHLDRIKTPFNLAYTLECGQVFGWVKIGETWCGAISDNIIKIKQDGKGLKFSSNSTENPDILKDYFRLDDDLPKIISEIAKDEHISKAIAAYHGLRLVRQQPWDCLLTYLCSINSNIPTISKMLFSLARRFGKKIDFESEQFHLYPSAQALSQASIEELKTCSLGFRATYIYRTAKRIASTGFDLNCLLGLDYYESKKKLLEKVLDEKTLPGVGPKVADCVLLFSLEKLDAFPIDVWIARVVNKYYRHLFDTEFSRRIHEKVATGNSLGSKDYYRIAEVMRNYFGRYAGYAQEYLYMAGRKFPTN